LGIVALELFLVDGEKPPFLEGDEMELEGFEPSPDG
jgi:hypothetical protein